MQFVESCDREFNLKLSSHCRNLINPLMLLRSHQVVIQCSTDTYLKLLVRRHVSSILLDTAEEFGIWVHEYLDLSICDWIYA